ncbi:hypothetical protein [Duncaniella muris]|uniref:hypothetical protein n=1 Tax=Duncaniella muris TaxID=2094150 RepID=UPI003F662B69
MVDSKRRCAKRLTTHSGNETPLAFKDNSHVVFSTSDMPLASAAQASFTQQVYTVDLDGGRPEMMVSLTMPALMNQPRRTCALSGPERGREHLRKHERSFGTADYMAHDKAASISS